MTTETEPHGEPQPRESTPPSPPKPPASSTPPSSGGDEVPIHFGATPSAPTAPPAPTQPKCPVGPDCPSCRGAIGGTICTTSGSRVWPRMPKPAARLWANIILGMIGGAIKLFRADKAFISPTEAEKDAFADALIEVSYQRASWMGAFSDIFAVLQSLGSYGSRALSHPPTKALPAPAPKAA